MPNHVTNVLYFECDGDESKKILDFLKPGNGDYGEVDFNKLIPMPESLNIECGSRTETGIALYSTAINPITKGYGKPKINSNTYFIENEDIIETARNYVDRFGKMTEKEMESHISDGSFEELYKLGKTAVSNEARYGATTWYDWCCFNWGTKWNAYECKEVNPEEGYVQFLTAWNSVPGIIAKISEKYPDITMEYSWADECIGSNTGCMRFENGEVVFEDFPEDNSARAYEIACEVLGYNLDEFLDNMDQSE